MKTSGTVETGRLQSNLRKACGGKRFSLSGALAFTTIMLLTTESILTGENAAKEYEAVGWGENNSSQATPPTGTDYLAIAAGDFYSLALKADGSIVAWGIDDYGQASPPAGNDFVAISAGIQHGLALKTDGSIVGWGRNNYGQATPPVGNDLIAID